MIVAQLCGYTVNHWIVYFKWVNYIRYINTSIKLLKRKKKKVPWKYCRLRFNLVYKVRWPILRERNRIFCDVIYRNAVVNLYKRSLFIHLLVFLLFSSPHGILVIICHVTIILITNHLKTYSYCSHAHKSVVAEPLSTMLLTLSMAQKKCPRCVCWIKLSHCQHFSELLGRS